jgi:hypothetical protein
VEEAIGEELLAQAGMLAKRWAIGLIVARPPHEIGEVPLEDLASEAPALCAAILRAVRCERDLERLTDPADPEHAAARRLASICGAHDASQLALAVEELRALLWQALLAQPLEDPERLAGEACDRLAHVCSIVLACALAGREPGEDEPAAAAVAGATRSLPLRPSAREHGPARAAIVDERDEDRGAPSSPAGAEIAARDERVEAGPAAWIGALGARLERFAEDGVPFAVLLAEVVDAERLRAHEPPGEPERLTAAFEQLLMTELRAHAGVPARPPWGRAPREEGSLTRERVGRLWMIVPDTDRAGGLRLAERLHERAAGLRTSRGSRVPVALGAASCPQDGRDASVLAAYADVAVHAARAQLRRSPGAGEPARM